MNVNTVKEVFEDGSKNVVKTKLFVGEYWEKIKNLIWKGEMKQRMEFKRIAIRWGVEKIQGCPVFLETN